MAWKILTEVKILTSIEGILIIVVALCVAIICKGSFKKWADLVDELNK